MRMTDIILRASQHTYSLPRIDPYMCKATNGVHSLLASTEFSYGRYPYSVKLTNSVQHPVFASKMEALHCNCMQAVLVRWCGHQRRRLAAKAGARRHRPTQHRSRISKSYGAGLARHDQAPGDGCACGFHKVPRHSNHLLGRNAAYVVTGLVKAATGDPRAFSVANDGGA